jgi:hypothetical protein
MSCRVSVGRRSDERRFGVCRVTSSMTFASAKFQDHQAHGLEISGKVLVLADEVIE